jgi:hypothetical protein
MTGEPPKTTVKSGASRSGREERGQARTRGQEDWMAQPDNGRDPNLLNPAIWSGWILTNGWERIGGAAANFESFTEVQ